MDLNLLQLFSSFLNLLWCQMDIFVDDHLTEMLLGAHHGHIHFQNSVNVIGKSDIHRFPLILSSCQWHRHTDTPELQILVCISVLAL